MSYFYTPWKRQKIKGLWFFENPNEPKLIEHAHYRLYNQNTNSGPPFTDQYPPLSFTENGPHFFLLTSWVFLKKRWKRLWKIYNRCFRFFTIHCHNSLPSQKRQKIYISQKVLWRFSFDPNLGTIYWNILEIYWNMQKGV